MAIVANKTKSPAQAAVQNNDNSSDITTLTMDDVFKPRLVVCASSLHKRGKTHFALDAPGPVLYIGIEKAGLEGVGQKFEDKIRKGLISKTELNWERPTSESKGSARVIRLAQDALDKFDRVYERGLKEYRTIIEDTNTGLWELFRTAEFGKLGEVMPHHYAPVNLAFQEHINRALACGVNLIMLNRVKEEWGDGSKKTGRVIRDGYKGAEYDAQVCIWMDRDYNPAGGDDPRWPSGPFYFQVYDCRQNASLVGQTFVQPPWNVEYGRPGNTFLDLAMAVYPESDPTIWL